jgi:hypothetical protein
LLAGGADAGIAVRFSAIVLVCFYGIRRADELPGSGSGSAA